MRTTHAYRLNGIETPRESLLQVRFVVDGKERHLSEQAATELAEDLLSAARDADHRAAGVRESLLNSGLTSG